MKAIIVAAAIAISGAYAYHHWAPASGILDEQLDRANALAILKAVESHQHGYWLDKDMLAGSLAELDRHGSGYEPTIKALAAASKDVQPYKGFRISEVSSGNSAAATRYGLLLLPASNAGKGYAMLMDMSKVRVEDTGRPVGESTDLYVFDAPSADAGSGWPAAATLAKWEKIERLTPQQGLAKAQGMAGALEKRNER